MEGGVGKNPRGMGGKTTFRIYYMRKNFSIKEKIQS